MAESRLNRSKAVDKIVDQINRGYTIDKKGIRDLLRVTNTSIYTLLTWANMEELPIGSSVPSLSREQFLQRQKLLIDVNGEQFRAGAEGSPLLSPEQNRVMRSDYRSSRAVDRWESDNHDLLVAVARLAWFMEAEVSIPDDFWTAACDWQQTVIEALQLQAQSLEQRAIGTGL